MKEHFTKEAGKIWSDAEKIASEEGHGIVAPEHVLMAFFRSDHDLANLVTEEFIGTYDILQKKVAEITEGRPLDPMAAENLMKAARKEANISFAAEIDLSHLLVAVFGDYKREETIPVKILKSFDINTDWFLKMVRFPRSLKKEASKETLITGALFTGVSQAGSRPGTSALSRYGRDLTSLAHSHKLDPVALREKEIDDIIEILCRRVKSNPLLIGEPGVGKSALMTGLAQRIANGDVPQKLKDAKIFELNLTSVIAGASVQGEFEKRMQSIIDYVRQANNIILFIDEIHTIVGTGGLPGLGDAANILKSPLVNGDIKCIGATTIKEYRRYIEKDPALARRFQTVEIQEPTVTETVEIIKSIKHLYEEFHHVRLPGEVIERAVELSVLHIKDQYLPDKAIDLIDQACARVGLMRGDADSAVKTVTIEDVAAVLSNKTKIPLEKLTSDKLEKLLKLEHLLKQRIIGQDEAISKIGDIIRLTKSSLGLKPVRPDGVFLFIGPTGVGKTETARALCEILFDDEKKMIRLDMSEYMEPHSISKIIGSPPGYIGSDQEGGLTGRVRTEPYSIILLDEVEKAHHDVLNVFLQVFEDGRLTDSQGRTVYFSNCTIIMTSNLGAASVFNRQREIGFNEEKGTIDGKAAEKALMEAVRKHFSPEFINRIDEVIYFKPLDKVSIENIARMRLDEIKSRFARNNREIIFSEGILRLVSEKGYNPEYGARFLNRTIESLVLKPLSRVMLANRDDKRLYVKVNNKQEITITGGGK